MALKFARTLAAAGLAVTLATGAAELRAQDEAPAEDPVVATVNGEEIRRSEVMAEIENLPPQYRQVPPAVLIPAIAEQMAAGVLIREAAYDAGLDETEEVQQRLAQAEERIIQEVWLERRLQERMTEEAMEDAYEAYLEENPPAEEVSASHILVETEEEAQGLIDQLDDGADFGELAREHSIGPSGEQGGDLGYFQRDQMVEPFADAAFNLEPGNYTQEPVETQFGWHVIRVEDARVGQPPTREDVADQLEQNLRQALVREILDDLLADAEIVLYGPDGEPMPQGEGPAAAPEAPTTEGSE
ncbi:MAG: peptidylprolyl isomerase [Alphaproteobacteria bacterium]|jgi:peptidyl-prolyl cis-trans isomerase C|nr:peptidylprolyl isomerase [Alphaproteobacteria bacterium]